MGNLLLPEIQSGVTQTDVYTIVFLERFVVFFPSDIIALSSLKEEGVADLSQILLDGLFINLHLLDALKRIGHLGGIGQGANGGAKSVRNGFQSNLVLDVVSVKDVGDVSLSPQVLQVIGFLQLSFTAKETRHSAIGVILFPELIERFGPASTEFFERKRIAANLLATVAEDGADVLGQ